MADTHTIMPKKLAQALMEAGMQHFDIGGQANVNRDTPNNNSGAISGSAITNPIGAAGQSGVFGGSNSTPNQFLNSGIGQAVLNPLGSLFGGAQNSFQAASAGDTSGQVQQQYGNQQDVYGQQQSLANQLLAQTQGGGPGNALIAQQGANLGAQQAATQAGVRGASANPGLVARNAAVAGQQGQQQTLNAQSNMELQSQGALAQQQSTMAGQALQGQQIGQTALSNANTVNAGVAGQNASTNGGILGGIMGGVGSALGSIFNQGGEVQKLADGGAVNPFDQGMSMFAGPALPQIAPPPAAAAAPVAAPQKGAGGAIGGVLSSIFAKGGNVPGKAPVSGDSPKNDVVPTLLSPGEDVIPRSITELPEKEMEKKAIEFLRHLKKGKKPGYEGVASVRRDRA